MAHALAICLNAQEQLRVHYESIRNQESKSCWMGQADAWFTKGLKELEEMAVDFEKIDEEDGEGEERKEIKLPQECIFMKMLDGDLGDLGDVDLFDATQFILANLADVHFPHFEINHALKHAISKLNAPVAHLLLDYEAKNESIDEFNFDLLIQQCLSVTSLEFSVTQRVLKDERAQPFIHGVSDSNYKCASNSALYYAMCCRNSNAVTYLLKVMLYIDDSWWTFIYVILFPSSSYNLLETRNNDMIMAFIKDERIIPALLLGDLERVVRILIRSNDLETFHKLLRYRNSLHKLEIIFFDTFSHRLTNPEIVTPVEFFRAFLARVYCPTTNKFVYGLYTGNLITTSGLLILVEKRRVEHIRALMESGFVKEPLANVALQRAAKITEDPEILALLKGRTWIEQAAVSAIRAFL